MRLRDAMIVWEPTAAGIEAGVPLVRVIRHPYAYDFPYHCSTGACWGWWKGGATILDLLAVYIRLTAGYEIEGKAVHAAFKSIPEWRTFNREPEIRLSPR